MCYNIFVMSKDKDFDIELFFAALADRTRLRLLNLIGDDEVCVCFFVEVIGTNQPKISRHLAYLKRAGLVSVRRDWKWSHYRLAAPVNPRAASVFREIRSWLKDEPEMQSDRKKMVNMCCAPAKMQPVSIQGAPKPLSIAA
jgi:ArsR family transcriptional regulator, arsenate/arsenite/antimonite-responsive transcriptional repressor